MVMGVVILLFLARVLVTYFLARLWEIKEDEEPRYRKVFMMVLMAAWNNAASLVGRKEGRKEM